jgi:hypothetical protein
MQLDGIFHEVCPELLVNSIEQSPSDNHHSVSEDITHILWNSNIYYCAHKSPPLAYMRSRVEPVHTLLFYSFNINFNTVAPSMPRSFK